MAQPSIFEFKTYRDFLGAWLAEAKLTKSSNLTKLAEVAGVHATFLSQVLLGRKDLSLEQAALLSSHLGLTKLERENFFALVQRERAGNKELREYWTERLREIETQRNRLSERFTKHQELDVEQKAIYYSSWKYVAVRLSTDVSGGQTAAQVAANFRMSPDEAQDVLTFLASNGLCVEDNGVYRLGPAHVHVPNESPFVAKHHVNWRTRAVVGIDSRTPDELFFTAPMVISEKDFERLREQLNTSIKSIVETAKASTSENVVCLNIDFFRAVRIANKSP